MHLYLEEPVLATCKKCGKPVLSHTVCQNCGYYKGAEVIDVFKKLTKKARKQKEKEMKAREEGEGKSKGPLSLERLSKR